MYKRALVSVSDKTGLLDFLKPLVEQGLKIISTGGTAVFLRQSGIEVQDVSEVTDFPEVLDGRVKTLHPKIHMALLAKSNNKTHMKTISEFNVDLFDLVVVNLYPFESALKDELPPQDMIEKIDVGGPTMLRAAAKNFDRITVVCDPSDYSLVSASPSIELNRTLAAKVFAHTSIYDSLIAKYLNPKNTDVSIWAGRKNKDLRYGENPHQRAQWYSSVGNTRGLQDFEIIQGKELSYNNLLDLDAALTLSLSIEGPNAVAVKHNNPCGAVFGNSNENLFEKLIKSDPVSIFGGIIATNLEIDEAAAQKLNGTFLECIVAKGFTSGARSEFSKKKNLRLLSTGDFKIEPSYQIKSILGGFLIQEPDSFHSQTSDWKCYGQTPPKEMISSFLFGEKVCAFLKSNSIALIDNQMTLGLGMGQVNRIDAIEHSLSRALKFHSISENTILISDAFFPFTDSIELIAKHNIRWVLQPGGSLKDEDVIRKAQELGVNLIFSGKKAF